MSLALNSLIQAGVHNEIGILTQVASVGLLAASIAHEVNQPLSGIVINASTCLRMLTSDPPNVAAAREAAGRMIRDGNRASEMIARLRTLFGKKRAATEAVDLNEVTRDVVAQFLTELQKNGVALHLELSEGLPVVRGDCVQLHQVILNLVRNASDAMMTIHDRPRHLVIRTGRDAEGCVRLSVEDVGVGFDLQAADALFQAFYTTKNDGMGIGLSLCRSIIERHQGRLWATLNDGPGATFSFAIPCSSEQNGPGNIFDAAEPLAANAA